MEVQCRHVSQHLSRGAARGRYRRLFLHRLLWISLRAPRHLESITENARSEALAGARKRSRIPYAFSHLDVSDLHGGGAVRAIRASLDASLDPLAFAGL